VAETVPLAGYQLSVRDYGTGSPTVIIEAGLACDKDLYTQLQFDLAQETRVIAYDHPGIGESTARDQPRTLPHYAAELRALIAQKHLEPPFILVGHSLGGHIIRYYTQLYPKDVAGLVFIDHPHEDWFRYIRATWSETEQDRYFKWWRPEGSTYKGTALKELLAYEENCDLVRGIYPPADVPVLMFTGSADMHYEPSAMERDRRMWTALQASIIAGSKDKKHVVDWETGHVPHRQKPELFAREIRAFIRKVRDKNK
jgi:pimeloyl-ACP methyl ester carboxylesterase